MNSKDSPNPVGVTSSALSQSVTFSPWVNEPLPPWTEILTAHDVARLIRRPPWLITGMAAIGRFPKKRSFQGHKIGWHQADILDWMTRDLHLENPAMTPRSRNRSKLPGDARQRSLQLRYAHGLSNGRGNRYPTRGVLR